jgi:hypothetical protein
MINNIGQALSTSMSYTDPVEVAKLCNTALDCTMKVHEEKGDAARDMQLVFQAKKDGDAMKVRVIGVTNDDLSNQATDGKIVKLTPPPNVENN